MSDDRHTMSGLNMSSPFVTFRMPLISDDSHMIIVLVILYLSLRNIVCTLCCIVYHIISFVTLCFVIINCYVMSVYYMMCDNVWHFYFRLLISMLYAKGHSALQAILASCRFSSAVSL